MIRVGLDLFVAMFQVNAVAKHSPMIVPPTFGGGVNGAAAAKGAARLGAAIRPRMSVARTR